jgi:uncharacterized protein (TIGR02466 family)
MLSSKGEIHPWFPKTLYVLDNLLLSQLPVYEARIKEIIKNHGSKRISNLYVDSTHGSDQNGPGNVLHQDPVFAELVENIYENAFFFLSDLGYDRTFIDALTIGNMWANVSHEGDFVFPHVHPNSILSGAYYIKKYPNSKIKFFDNLESIYPRPQLPSHLNFDFCEYDCDPGRLIMFKSDFLHGTERQPSDEKIVISFNLVLNDYRH